MDDLKKMTDWDKLGKLLKTQEDNTENRVIDEKALVAHLKDRIKGQDPIVEDVARLLHLQLARKNLNRPIANLLFLGPTGTGKTELAKAIGEFLYGDEKAILRFDCSELTGEHSKDRLIGVPTGYVGAELGGQLTRPMISNPRRLVLFDEIEKAYSGVFDLFLQLMGEGRLTEQGSGTTADFSQAIIILTSNARAEEIGKIKESVTDYMEMVNAVKGYLADTKVFRTEIVARIDKLYVFNKLEGMIVAEIAVQKIIKLAKSYGLKISFVAPELILKALAANEKISRFGIRELERIVFDMFAQSMIEAREAGAAEVTFQIDDKGQIAVTRKAGPA